MAELPFPLSRLFAGPQPDYATWSDWKRAALEDDRRSGAEQWKRTERSERYDYRMIRQRLNELRAVRASGDPHRMLYLLHEGIHGNLGGIGSAKMYRTARLGTKVLITDYLSELESALASIHEADERVIDFDTKLAFFRRASLCYGRSALMLSGGGSLGPFHIGVVRALLEQQLLPQIISGASAGSLVAALVGTHTDAELPALLDGTRVRRMIEEGGAAMETPPRRARIAIEDVRATVAAAIPDLTFEEAFALTGRKINVSVSPREFHQQSRLLNAITSPNVLIREAVLASCAVPGVFPPVTLMARNSRGERQPYIPNRQWIDGSVTDDLPAKRLTRLYGVNHFITSQTNPVVLWALRDTQSDDNLAARLFEIQQNATREWFKATWPLAMDLTRGIWPLNVLTRMTYGIATQDYTADINILPEPRLRDPRTFLAVLSDRDIQKLVHEGEMATWPKVEMIRNCTCLSRALDRHVAELEARIHVAPPPGDFVPAQAPPSLAAG